MFPRILRSKKQERWHKYGYGTWKGKVEMYDKNMILRQAGLKVLKSKKVWQVRPLIYIKYPGSKRPPTR